SDAAAVVRDRYDRARRELTSLKPSRPVQELEALAKVRAKPGSCAVENVTGRLICPKAHDVGAELGRAKRRAELEAILATESEAIATGPATQVADPGSTALVTYLGALGISVSSEVVSQWLNLIPVLALELGSALAMVLVAIREPRPEPIVLNHAP